MKHLSRFTLVVLVVLLVGALALPVLAQENPPVDSLTVSGSGSAFGEPDSARIEVGVSITNVDILEAFSEANTTMNAVVEALLALGIDRADLQTTGINLWTEERYGMVAPGAETDNSPIYHVDNNLRVIVRDISIVDQVIAEAVNAGANRLNGLSYTISDTSALEQEARAAAVANARARAENLAEIMGVSLGAPIIIVEQDTSLGGPVPAFAEAAMGMGGGGVPVETGQLAVSINVRVTFAISQ